MAASEMPDVGAGMSAADSGLPMAAGNRAPSGGALDALRSGCVIPAHPLALTAERRLDERHQRALTRYYVAAGAGGIAVAVHTTQFAIREARHGLLRPVLELAAETARAAASGVSASSGERSLPAAPARADLDERRMGPDRAAPRVARTGPGSSARFALVAGVCGRTEQATAEAELARSLGYDAGLLSLAALRGATTAELIAHCRAVAEIVPVIGFYLQPAVGGVPLDYAFWCAFAEIPNVVAVKIAPFDRYRTIDVVRAVVDTGRDDIALYTGNDDNIVGDLVTPFPLAPDRARAPRRIVGGLLGQWAVWTRRAVELLDRARAAGRSGEVPDELLGAGAALTDANGAVFDVRHGFAGCIAGIHEVLRRQGLMSGTWCLDPTERLSPGQSEEIDRVTRSYPELTDDEFVRERLDEWLK